MDIAANPEESDSHGDYPQKDPAQERQGKQKELHFVAIHHFFALFDGVDCRDFGVFCQNEVNHRVRQTCDEARNDQQQTPQEDIKSGKQNRHKTAGEIVEAFKDHFNLYLFTPGYPQKDQSQA